jgi:hypothetical protein
MSDLDTAGAVCRRDLLVMARHRPMLAALAAYAALLSSFLLAWSGAGAAPWLGGTNLYEQQRTVQTGATALIVPWVVCRFMDSERGDRWAMMIRLTGLSSAWLSGAHLLALTAFVAVAVASGWPLLLVAQQMSAVPARTAVTDGGALLAFALAATLVSMGFALVLRGSLAAWVGATLTILALSGLPDGARPPLIAVAGVAAIALGLANTPRADSFSLPGERV